MQRLLVIYHFFHPDDVVSARHFSDLAEEQSKRGWQVTALTSNRACRDPELCFPPRERWNRVDIIRSHRPAWNQSKPLSRLSNGAWLNAAWLFEYSRLEKFDAVIVGTDPAFLPLIIPLLKLQRPRPRVFQWCFDLYPEAIAAEGAGLLSRSLLPLAHWGMGRAYQSSDCLVDIGPRMRERLQSYGFGKQHETLVPWALVEPYQVGLPDLKVRKALFPNAKLTLLYSGTMGKAHDFDLFLRLARVCRVRSGNDISFCFASRGNRMADLREALQPDDTNVSLAPFTEESQLQARLEAADIHLMSLRQEWSGLVVPSKFFGSLAVGRPVLYSGPEDSDIARWIFQLGVGRVLTPEGISKSADWLHDCLADPSKLFEWQAKAFKEYSDRFSKRIVNDGWNALLRSQLPVNQAL